MKTSAITFRHDQHETMLGISAGTDDTASLQFSAGNYGGTFQMRFKKGELKTFLSELHDFASVAFSEQVGGDINEKPDPVQSELAELRAKVVELERNQPPKQDD